jgi:fucose 4-O-acetylase-like acetyltransferase
MHAETAPRQHPARDPWLDNTRFALIVLVVLGHCLEPLLDESPLFATTYRFIYLFHIPAFAFLSGAVARADAGAHLLRNVVFRLLLPYLAFQAIYSLAAQWPAWPDRGPAGVATPYWLLWYLLSLAGWRLLLPWFARLRWPLLSAIALAIAAGCASGLGYYLSLSRTLVFFPMFVLGWRYCHPWRAKRTGVTLKLAAAAMLLALLAAASDPAMNAQWLYGSQGYARLGTDAAAGMALRLLQLGAGIAGTAAFLTLIPKRPLPVSAMGARSMPTYLLHGLLVKFAVAAGIFGMLRSLPDSVAAPLLIVMTLACVFALCTRPAQRLLEPVIAPRWLERRL